MSTPSCRWPVDQPGAPGQPSRELTPDEAAAIEPPGYIDADVQFMHAMILHHEQALRMTAYVPARTARHDLPLLAKRMDISQRDELALMRHWLRERGEEESSAHAGHGQAHHAATIPGMIAEADLQRLEAAEGRAFDRLFLELMIRHHEGALAMVEELDATSGAGAEPEIANFARHVDADQRIEIARMQELQAKLGA